MNVDEFVKGHIYNKRAWTTFYFSNVINLKVLVFNLYVLKSSMFKSQVPVLLLHEIMGTKCLCYSSTRLWVPSACATPAWDYGYQMAVLLLHEIMSTKCLCYSCMRLWVPSACVTPAWDYGYQVPVLLLHEIMGTKCLCYSCMGLWVPSVCVTPAWYYGYHAKTDHSSGQIASVIRQNANLKTGVSRKQSTPNFPKQWTFLTPWYTGDFLPYYRR